MRYLVLSDIHSNLEALTAVLQRVRRKRFDRVVILGDLVGYGADPNLIVDRVRKLKRSVIIRGNHDKVCSGIDNGDMFNKIALQSARWTEDQLLPRHRKWLRALPKGPVKVGDVFSISHGTPLDEDAYIFGEIEALNMFQYFETPICFFGHSHFPVVFGLDDEALTTHIPLTHGSDNCRIKLDKTTRYLINPGLDRPAPRRRQPRKLRHPRRQTDDHNHLPRKIPLRKNAAKNPCRRSPRPTCRPTSPRPVGRSPYSG